MKRYKYIVKIQYEDGNRVIEGTRHEESHGMLVVYDGETVEARLTKVESWSRELMS